MKQINKNSIMISIITVLLIVCIGMFCACGDNNGASDNSESVSASIKDDDSGTADSDTDNNTDSTSEKDSDSTSEKDSESTSEKDSESTSEKDSESTSEKGSGGGGIDLPPIPFN